MASDTLKSADFSDAERRLAQQLAGLDAGLRARLHGAGFDANRLLKLAASIGDASAPDAAVRREARNRVEGDVRGPAEGDILVAERPGSAEHARLVAIGDAALESGELAFCVMAGGMATRMGGVVKALVEAFDGRTFLDLRLAENRTAAARAKKTVPLWLMTSDATDAPIKEALLARKAPAHVTTFMQDLGVRLTLEGTLFLGPDGAPSTYATGHGDLPDALRRSGLLASFRAGGGKYVWIANLDNLGASIDAAILGKFIDAGTDVMVEVCDKRAGDRGGIPVHAQGRLQVLEEFRLPRTFDASSVRVFNTNTFLVRADALETASIPSTFFEVEKKVNDKPAIQFERLLQELTAKLPSAYLRVPREGLASRFLPVKDHDELEKRRADIEAVARGRGMVTG